MPSCETCRCFRRLRSMDWRPNARREKPGVAEPRTGSPSEDVPGGGMLTDGPP